MSQRRSEETVNKYTKELVFCFVLPLAEEGGEPMKWFKQVYEVAMLFSKRNRHEKTRNGLVSICDFLSL